MKRVVLTFFFHVVYILFLEFLMLSYFFNANEHVFFYFKTLHLQEPTGPTPPIVLKGDVLEPNDFEIWCDGIQSCRPSGILQAFGCTFAAFYVAQNIQGMVALHCCFCNSLLGELESKKTMPTKIQNSLTSFIRMMHMLHREYSL